MVRPGCMFSKSMVLGRLFFAVVGHFCVFSCSVLTAFSMMSTVLY